MIVPADYEELLAYYTHKGYRVIGVATRHLPRLSWVKAQKMTRAEVESELDFVGFIIFENKLKPTTAAVLKELHDSKIGAVMVTGDNILTAISVARECGLIDSTAHCFVPHFTRGTSLRAMIWGFLSSEAANTQQAIFVIQQLNYSGRASTTTHTALISLACWCVSFFPTNFS